MAVQLGEAIKKVKKGLENGGQCVRTMLCGRLTVEAEEEQEDGEACARSTLCDVWPW